MNEIMLGVLFGALVGSVASLAFTNSYYWGAFVLGLVILCGAAGGVCGRYVAGEASTRYVESYLITKATIESSLANEDLSGFERVQLVTAAADHNQELAEKKYSATKWYGAFMDDRLKDLEFIQLGGSDGRVE